LAPVLLGTPLNIGVSKTSPTHMTAIKKTTTKSAKSPAPATKTAAKPAAKTAAKKQVPAAPAARAKTQKRVAVVTAPAPVASTPVIKSIATKAAATTITARIDIGFGNALYLRGDGPGLSWEKGVAMNCLGSDLWEMTLPESPRVVIFKFLVNDLTWNTGADYSVASGESVVLTPEF
jgi:hypothetical protein